MIQNKNLVSIPFPRKGAVFGTFSPLFLYPFEKGQGRDTRKVFLTKMVFLKRYKQKG